VTSSRLWKCGVGFKINRPGEGLEGVRSGSGSSGRGGWRATIFLNLLRKRLVIEHIFEYNGGVQLGDHNMVERAERSPLNVVLDRLGNVYAELLDTLESGGLDQLNAAEKISFWQEFEAFRNRLALIDHRLVADAEATNLASEYCFSSLTMLLTRTLLLSPTEAAARVRAAAAVGTRISTTGESLDPVLPNLAAAQGEGTVSPEQVRICGAGHAEVVPSGPEPR
jgi:Domain of unknown function (DUF222)